MEYENLDDPHSEFLKRIQNTSSWFKNIEISLVIVKEKEKNLLIEGKAIFVYKDDDNKKEVTYDYGRIVLARRILEIDEFIQLFPSESSNLLDIKDLKSLFLGTSFDQSVYHIPSNTEELHVLLDWPSRVYRYGGDYNTSYDGGRDFLVKPNCPSFPNLNNAIDSFLDEEHDFRDHRIVGLKIILPDYRTRIKTVEISDKNLTIETESREINQNQLILKINSSHDKDRFLSDDISINQKILSVKIPFEPKTLYLFLIDKNSGDILDFVEFGNYTTNRLRHITIKTSSELIESLIIKGETKNIELKRQMSDQFLESVAAFANTDGGKIILGVDDRQKIVGIHGDFTNLEKQIRGTIRGMIQPQIEVNVELIEVRQSPIVVVTVPKGENRPYLLDGVAYIRNDEADIAMGRSELDAIYASKQSSERLPFRSV